MCSTSAETHYDLDMTHNGTRLAVDISDNRYEDEVRIRFKVKKADGSEQDIVLKVDPRSGGARIMEDGEVMEKKRRVRAGTLTDEEIAEMESNGEPLRPAAYQEKRRECGV